MITVYFDIVDSAGGQLFTRLHITPFNSPLPYNGQVVSSDSISLRDICSPVTCSLVPNFYEVTLFGRNTKSQFILNLPTSSDDQTVSASAFMVGCPPYAGFTASYATVAGSILQNQSLAIQLWDAGFQRYVSLVSYNGVLGVI